MPRWGRKSNGKFDSFQGLFERKQLRDQALVIGRGAHGVLENLVDRMNDFGNSNDFADCGWDRRHCKRWARARADFGVKYTLNIQGRMASMRRCTLQCPSAVQNLSGIRILIGTFFFILSYLRLTRLEYSVFPLCGHLFVKCELEY